MYTKKPLLTPIITAEYQEYEQNKIGVHIVGWEHTPSSHNLVDHKSRVIFFGFKNKALPCMTFRIFYYEAIVKTNHNSSHTKSRKMPTILVEKIFPILIIYSITESQVWVGWSKFSSPIVVIRRGESESSFSEIELQKVVRAWALCS